VFGNVLVNAGGDELLHAQLDLALLGIDGQHQRLDHLPRAQHVAGMIDAAVGDNLAHMHQAFNAVRKLHKRAKVHDLGNGAFNLRALGELLSDLGPWVGKRLFEAERDASLLRLDGQDDRVHAIAGLDHVTRMAHLFAPGHFGYMDEAFNAGLDFDKGAEVLDAGDDAVDALAGLEAAGHGGPWLRLKLLEAE
jgi:hypothetical protein